MDRLSIYLYVDMHIYETISMFVRSFWLLLRMREKLVTTVASLRGSHDEIEKAYNGGVVDGFSKQWDTQPPVSAFQTGFKTSAWE